MPSQLALGLGCLVLTTAHRTLCVFTRYQTQERARTGRKYTFGLHSATPQPAAATQATSAAAATAGGATGARGVPRLTSPRSAVAARAATVGYKSGDAWRTRDVVAWTVLAQDELTTPAYARRGAASALDGAFRLGPRLCATTRSFARAERRASATSGGVGEDAGNEWEPGTPDALLQATTTLNVKLLGTSTRGQELHFMVPAR